MFEIHVFKYFLKLCRTVAPEILKLRKISSHLKSSQVHQKLELRCDNSKIKMRRKSYVNFFLNFEKCLLKIVRKNKGLHPLLCLTSRGPGNPAVCCC